MFKAFRVVRTLESELPGTPVRGMLAAAAWTARAWFGLGGLPLREAALKLERKGLISVVLLRTPRGLVVAQKREGRK